MKFDWHTACEKHWNRISDNWQANSQEMWDTGSRKAILPVFTPFLNPQKGPVLDAGCGDGYGSLLLAEKGYEVVGVDIAEQMVERAKERMKDDLALSFTKADLMNLPFEESSFQAIMAINVIEWVQSPLQILHQFKGILMPDGMLALGILGPTAAPRQHSYRRLYGDEVVCNTLMPWECGRLLEENGYCIIHQEGVYKRGVTDDMTAQLSIELRQALSFLWVFYARPAA
ncbi:class I SAM-dependent methyltransferase [Aneurinibacillus tyrosinisolvens]|uniref:class I SAM-dependent methyltransferase n=1 Tax=Aneurinibacillus tyrosinisolvens TaxID=1443435 RepID=UPI00063F4476|nr:class I SAM-dependent methyltransferase [Aneurinibacillus tyrosinisolvens]